MQSDDDLQTTLSKWPFILGDLLLVATALAIAILPYFGSVQSPYVAIRMSSAVKLVANKKTLYRVS